MQRKAGDGLISRLRSDSVFGFLLVLAVLVLEGVTGFLGGIESRFYDHSSLQTQRLASQQVVVLTIDDQSIANIGRWPWPRDVHAKVIDTLTKGGAKTIAHTAFFFEPQIDRGLQPLTQIQSVLAQAPSGDPLFARLKSMVDSAIGDLDSDAALVSSMHASNRVLLPLVFELGDPLGRPDKPLPDFVRKDVVSLDASTHFIGSTHVTLPFDAVGRAAYGVGHLNQLPDTSDGVVRSDLLLIDHDGVSVPSLALHTAAHSLNLSMRDLKFVSDGQMRFGGISIPIDEHGRVFTQFYSDKDDRSPFVQDSFFDVYSGKIPASKYAGKIVVIGATAAGIGDRFVTPISAVTSPALVLAHTTSSLLSGHFFTVPFWGGAATFGATLLVAFFVAGLLPRLSAGVAAAVTGGSLIALLLAESLMIVSAYIWIPLVLPATALVIGYLGLTTKRFWLTEAGKIKSDEESAETNRMMGLAHQGQGQLDLAFDRFRRVPMSDALMDNLSNLALDFERKRQFNKAQAVYEHMATFNPNHKDLQNKLKRIKNLSETVMLGGNSHKGGTILLDEGMIEKPMLGRYQVEKELGKGAMGVVYLGKDPKIGRVVAIKTMALAQEFDGSELEDARQRFFREAETAGRLQHQNIVTIFDAGEDHDLAYIAMEFLKGKDLVGYAQPGHLLPQEKVVAVLIQIAQALNYAHSLNVVHRDIKPANIMYEAQTGTIKVTDFGIARVTDASRTRTGMVLGTPSFMSPEQIAGKKVDGRSDLYSLGVMAFQLLTGVLPFRAESMAELMFKIANEPAPDVRTLNSAVSDQLAAVVARALSKSLEVRYATGQAMAEALQMCLQPSVLTETVGVTVGAEDAALSYQSTNTRPEDFATTVVMTHHQPDGAGPQSKS